MSSRWWWSGFELLLLLTIVVGDSDCRHTVRITFRKRRTTMTVSWIRDDIDDLLVSSCSHPDDFFSAWFADGANLYFFTQTSQRQSPRWRIFVERDEDDDDEFWFDYNEEINRCSLFDLINLHQICLDFHSHYRCRPANRNRNRVLNKSRQCLMFLDRRVRKRTRDSSVLIEDDSSVTTNDAIDRWDTW